MMGGGGRKEAGTTPDGQPYICGAQMAGGIARDRRHAQTCRPNVCDAFEEARRLSTNWYYNHPLPLT